MFDAVIPAIDKNPVVPILESILVIQKDGVLKVVVSDLQTTLTASSPHNAESCAFIVPAGLKLFLQDRKDLFVSFRISEDKQVWRCDLDTFSLPNENILSFPKAPSTGLQIAAFNVGQIQDVIGILATSPTPVDRFEKEIFKGIHARKGENGTLVFYTLTPITSKRLYTFYENQTEQHEFTLYRKAAHIFSAISGDDGSPVQVQVFPSHISLNLTHKGIHINLLTRQLEETISDEASTMFDGTGNASVEVKLDEMVKAIKKLSFTAKQHIEFSVNGKLTIGLYKGNKQITLQGTHQGDDNTVVFKASTFQNFFSKIEDTTVHLKLSGELGAMIYNGENEDRLLMPINKNRL